jgi:phosphate transport system substrate-binding protein
VIGFGEVLPMACDTTVVGQGLNRRVELWLRPATRAVNDQSGSD